GVAGSKEGIEEHRLTRRGSRGSLRVGYGAMVTTRQPSFRAALQIGKRVYLRHPTARDEDEYLALRRRSAAFLRRWEPAAPRGKTPDRLYADWLESRRDARPAKLPIRPQGR